MLPDRKVSPRRSRFHLSCVSPYFRCTHIQVASVHLPRCLLAISSPWTQNQLGDTVAMRSLKTAFIVYLSVVVVLMLCLAELMILCLRLFVPRKVTTGRLQTMQWIRAVFVLTFHFEPWSCLHLVHTRMCENTHARVLNASKRWMRPPSGNDRGAACAYHSCVVTPSKILLAD